MKFSFKSAATLFAEMIGLVIGFKMVFWSISAVNKFGVAINGPVFPNFTQAKPDAIDLFMQSRSTIGILFFLVVCTYFVMWLDIKVEEEKEENKKIETKE